MSLAERANTLGQRRPQPLFVRPAVGGRDGVAVIAVGAVRPQRPRDRPLGAALIGARKVLRPGEELGGDAFACADLFGKVIGEPAGELEHRLGRNLGAGERRGALPADFHPGVEIRLGAGEAKQPRGLECRILTENLGIGDEADRGAAPVWRPAKMDERAGGEPAAELLRVELLAARHLDPGERG
jgi:hypothetical protein